MKFEEIEVTKFIAGLKQPYSIFFVYTPDGNYVVKGMSEAVKTYVHQRFPRSFYQYTFWRKPSERDAFFNRIVSSRGGWSSPMKLYFRPKKIGKRVKTFVSMNTKDGFQTEFMSFRRMPHKWIPIFSEALLG